MSDENIIELNQEKEIIQVNEEKVEKEEKEEKDDKESSQEDQDNQKEQIKEEKIEEADLENQEPQENNEPEPETIIFSNLSKEEKLNISIISSQMIQNLIEKKKELGLLKLRY